MDLVATCPKGFWSEWLAEGDCAGTAETGEEYGWYTGHSYIRLIEPGDRFYVVAHGRLRGWAPATAVSNGFTHATARLSRKAMAVVILLLMLSDCFSARTPDVPIAGGALLMRRCMLITMCLLRAAAPTRQATYA